MTVSHNLGANDTDDNNNDEEESHRTYDEHRAIWGPGDEAMGYDSGSDRDFTACSADGCGYCGRCDY